MSTLQQIMDSINNNAPLSTAEIVQMEVNNFKNSKLYKKIQLADEYYANEGEITKRLRYTIGSNGVRREVENLLSNIKIPHSYYQKLTDQKTGYLMGKPFDVQAEGSEEYQKQLKSMFNHRFKRDLKRIGKDAIAGRGWMHVFIGEEGQLAFRRLAPLQVVPLWADEEQRFLGGVIYMYNLIEYQVMNKIEIQRFELWTTEGIEYFEIDPRRGGTMLPVEDVDGKPLRGDHLLRIIEGKDPDTGLPVQQTEGYNWERVPFIPFRYNADEMPLLDRIKDLVDDYDRKKSDISNQIEDIPAAIMVVKNFSGTNPQELREYIKKYRTVFVEADGGVDTMDNMLRIADGLEYLETVRRDIFDFGRGVDTKSDKFTAAASGIAIKQIYQELDSDVSDMETEFQLGMEDLIWFINNYLRVPQDTEVEIIFNRDLPINESEAIQDAKNSVGIVSDDTIIANHPWTKEFIAEKKRLEEQRAKANERSLEANYGFDNTAGGANNGNQDEDL